MSKTAGVTATTLAVHLGLSQPRIAQLAAEGVIPKRPDGRFDLDACRLAYLKWLRDPSRRSARSEAASALVAAKAYDIEVRTRQRLTGQTGR
jgi:phage terminase Nu1 subunit (DNA packaging protein)